MSSHYRIGVNVSPASWGAVEEFFELFKTPWERAQEGRHYGVIISDSSPFARFHANLFLVFSSATGDGGGAMNAEMGSGPQLVSWRGGAMPVYGSLTTFGPADAHSTITAGDRSLDRRSAETSHTVWQVGYDLFAEVDRLLRQGQPVDYAHVPALDQHIGLVRSLLLESGVPVIEVPPRPSGFDFVCCLTHDLDFFGITRHRADRTLAGFVVRASVGGVVDILRGRRTPGEALRNIRALLTLPLVFLGWIRDFWQPFEDYAQVEAGASSTFFLVPFRGRPGISPDGHEAPARAVPYQISDIAAPAAEALTRGSELGVHGIDAWRDAAAGRSELGELTAVTGQRTAGIRMHWLYYSLESPRHLEAAGFAYDSTWGYNETVGYRAGTSQVFRLPETGSLMELPLTIMDSALFSGGRMGLRPAAAAALWEPIVANAKRDGGTIVINWHDRSLAPERLWGRAYRALLARVARGNRVWYATAGDAVDWFRWRRAIKFELAGDEIRVSAAPTRLPEGMLCVSRATSAGVERHTQHLGPGVVAVRPAVIHRQPEALSAVN